MASPKKLILTGLPLQRPCLQIQSLSETLGVRIPIYLVLEVTQFNSLPGIKKKKRVLTLKSHSSKRKDAIITHFSVGCFM